QRLELRGEGSEDDAAARRDAELPEPVLIEPEARRHAALLLEAAAERHADEVAGEVVGPLMVGTDELLGVAARRAAKLGAAMGAAVLDDAHRAVAVARDDDRGRPDEGALEVAGVRDLRLERDEVPGGSMEDALDLA